MKTLEQAERERLAAPARPARAELAGMDREALMARIEALLGATEAAVHHRDLQGMTEVDLRSAVADVEALLDGGEA